MANVKFSKEELETAAIDVSQIFETPIPTGAKTTIKKLKNDLIEAATELQADDKITDKTIKILTSLGARLPSSEEKSDLKLDKDEKTEEEEKKEKKKGEKKGEKKEEKKYNRAQAFCDALRGNAKTLTEITRKAMKLHSDAHPNKNQPQFSSIEWAVRDYLAPLIILNFVKVQDKKYLLIAN